MAAPADRLMIRDAYLDGEAADAVFHQVWTVAMVFTDLAVIVTGSPYVEPAAADLVVRPGDL